MLPFLFLTQEVKVFPLFDIKYGDYPVTTYSGWHFDNNIFSFSVCAFMCRWITFIHEIMVALHIKGQNFYLFIYLFFNFFWLNYVSLFYLTFTNTPNSYPLKLFFFFLTVILWTLKATISMKTYHFIILACEPRLEAILFLFCRS